MENMNCEKKIGMGLKENFVPKINLSFTFIFHKLSEAPLNLIYKSSWQLLSVITSLQIYLHKKPEGLLQI